MRLELTLPASLRGQTVMLDTLEAVDGSTDTKALLRPILQIIERAVSSGIQQEFFANFALYATEANLPRQGLGDFTIALDIPEHALDAARQDLLDIAVAGSDRIWQTTADGHAAAIFEVICDILDEGLAPVEQQALLDANLADLAS